MKSKKAFVKSSLHRALFILCLLFTISSILPAQSANSKPNISQDELTPKGEASSWAQGSVVPNLIFSDIFTKQFDLYSLLDKPLIIEFTSLKCAQCTNNKTALKSFYKRYNINILSITTDEHINQLRKFTKDNQLNWSTVYDDASTYKQETFSKANFDQEPKFLLITADKRVHSIYYNTRDIGKLGVALKTYFSQ